MAPQSFGSLLNANIHLHSLCSLGVFDRQGNFHPAPRDLDFSPLEKLFRELTFKMMLEAGAITAERIAMMRNWDHSGFNINTSRRVPAGDREGLESLLRYMERPPVALSRLTYRPDRRVHYQGARFHPGLGRDHQLVSGVEFLAMLVPHISLRYEVTIRCYGALSSTIRRRFGWVRSGKCAPPRNIPVIEGEESEFTKVRRRNWARLIAKVWLENPALCSRCRSPMVVLAAISSPAQDEVIEKILKHLNRWDPPWLRRRPARGPPAQRALFEEVEESQVQHWNPEDENQDGAAAEWCE
jgi:hypothetical protein